MAQIDNELYKWLKSVHTEKELWPPPACFMGTPQAWRLEVARVDMTENKLPEQFRTMVKAYFDEQDAWQRELDRCNRSYDVPPYIDVEVPGSAEMGNAPVYVRYYTHIPEMGEG